MKYLTGKILCNIIFGMTAFLLLCAADGATTSAEGEVRLLIIPIEFSKEGVLKLKIKFELDEEKNCIIGEGTFIQYLITDSLLMQIQLDQIRRVLLSV